jgi:hypothetical protein
LARLHLPHVHIVRNPLAGLVACGIKPASTTVRDSPPGAGWADERVAELRRKGVRASIMRVPGESPVVTYRLS